MVWGVVFRAAGTLALGALLNVIAGDILLRLLGYANHPDHWLVQGLETVAEVDTVVLVLSVAVMLLANVLNRRVSPGGMR